MLKVKVGKVYNKRQCSGNETIIQGVTGDKVEGSGNLFTFGVTKLSYMLGRVL
jgi:hypothetical protein